ANASNFFMSLPPKPLSGAPRPCVNSSTLRHLFQYTWRILLKIIPPICSNHDFIFDVCKLKRAQRTKSGAPNDRRAAFRMGQLASSGCR
ncbi:MAG: hypothetical protein RSG50_07000, partial [Clostridia bacterium]